LPLSRASALVFWFRRTGFPSVGISDSFGASKVTRRLEAEPTKILGDALRAEIKDIVREALREERVENTNTSGTEKDTLLTAKETAALIGVNVRWMYRHADKLPFTRRLNRKTLRFSKNGLDRWVAAKKPDFRR
jgi:hypothetical protein